MQEALTGLGASFLRADRCELDRGIERELSTLGASLARHDVGLPAFVKINIEGIELDIFQDVVQTLRRLLVMRIEVCFARFRKDHPGRQATPANDNIPTAGGLITAHW